MTMNNNKELLSPRQIAGVRNHDCCIVQYGSVVETTVKRATVCRSCGETIAKGSAALNFYWDFNGCGSWTAGACYMHPACEPADEATRTAANRAAMIAMFERKLEKLDNRWDNAGHKLQDRIEREIKHVEKVLKELKGQVQ